MDRESQPHSEAGSLVVGALSESSQCPTPSSISPSGITQIEPIRERTRGYVMALFKSRDDLKEPIELISFGWLLEQAIELATRFLSSS